MSAGTYSFIDIAVLEPVRARFAAGDALAILTVDLGEVVWANGAGAALLGFDDIESVMGASPGFSPATRRQIAAAPGFPHSLTGASVAARIASGLVNLVVTGIALPDGEGAVLLAVPAAKLGSRARGEVAARIIDGIGEAGYFAALMDGDGRIQAASAEIETLGLGAQTRAALVADVLDEPDRLVKRLVPSASGMIPVGVARLTDDPPSILLIAVDEVDAEEGSANEEAAAPSDADLADRIEEDAALAPSEEAAAPGIPAMSGADLDSEILPEPFLADDEAVEAAPDDDMPVPSDADVVERLDEDAVAASRDAVATQPPSDQRSPSEDTVRPAGESDDWYFARSTEVPQLAAFTATDLGDERDDVMTAEEEGEIASTPIARPDRASGPVRFVWRTDASGAFSAMSDDFARAVGAEAANVIGRRFRDVATEFGLDPDGDIAGLLERRDTWSGRSVLWPVAGTDLLAPVDLAALPIYNRERSFEGFRGFGVVRMADVVVDPQGLGLRIGRQESPQRDVADAGEPHPAEFEMTSDVARDDELSLQSSSGGDDVASGLGRSDQNGAVPPEPEVPVISIAERRERRSSDKIIRLAERRVPQAPATQLSAGERNAFDEIRERLRKDYEASEVVRPEAESRDDGGPGDEAVDDAISEAGDEFYDERSLELIDGIADHHADVPQDDNGSRPEETSSVDDAQGDVSGEVNSWRADNNEIVEAYSDAGVPSAEHDDAGTEYDAQAGEADNRPSADVDEDEIASFDEMHAADITSSGDEARDTDQDEIAAAGDKDAAANNGPDEAVVEAQEPSRRDAELPDADAAAAFTPAPPLATTGFLPSAFSQEAGRASVDADLIEGLPVPLLVHAGDDLFFANREFLDLTGFASLEQIRREGGIGRLFVDRQPDPAEGPTRQPRLRTLGGDEFAVVARLQSIRWRGRSALLLAVRRVDVAIAAPATATSPPAVDAASIGAMERSVAEMRTIIDTATDGVVLIDNDGVIRNISRPAEALFGVDSHEVEGSPFTSLFAFESQRAARDYLTGLAENGVASVLNDGREVIGREARGRFIPLFMTIGRLPGGSGFCAVVRDITQWKRAEEELTQARTLAERASAQKTEFLARVSHEIRTPLNAIIGFSELMMDEKFGPIGSDRYRDYLRDINRSGNHVLDLVNDLLDISKIEAGEQEMNYEAVSLNDTLAESVAMMQPQANRERVIIRSSLGSRLPEVVADLRSVRQIALNLLSNAIRYTQAGGQVIVSTAYEPTGDVVMRVRDTGVGMSLSEIDQALKPFRQINALKRGRHDGTGLGLPLTKAMVEANRARFAISSTPGEGTMVEITFPSTRVLAD